MTPPPTAHALDVNPKVPHAAQVVELRTTLTQPLTLLPIFVVVLDVILEHRIPIPQGPVPQRWRIDDKAPILEQRMDIHQRVRADVERPLRQHPPRQLHPEELDSPVVVDPGRGRAVGDFVQVV